MSNQFQRERTENAGGWQGPSLLIGVIALAACAAGGYADPVNFFRAYLPAWLFFFGLSLGSMTILMIYHLTGGAWGFLIRRILEAAMRALPLVGLMFLPIAFGIHYLYPFAQPEALAADRQLQHQTFYLTPDLFWIRAGVYFALWLIISFFLSAWSRQQDDIEGRLAWKCQQLSAFGALTYGITLHFAAVDWAMSVMPAFHSSIWGPAIALGQLLSALAFTLIVFAGRVRRAPLAELVCPQVMLDLGSLLLTFLIAWAYMNWFQFMLIWIANLPTDIIYYLPRASRLWLGVIWAVVVLNFAVPFFALLMRSVKRRPVRLARVAGLILVMQLIFVYYEITPSFPPQAASTADAGQNAVQIPPGEATPGEVPISTWNWMNFVAPIGLGGIWLACFLWLLDTRPLTVAYDPHRAAALRLRRLAEEEEEEKALVGAHGEVVP